MNIRKAAQEDIDLILKNRMEFIKNIVKVEPTSQFEEDTYNFLSKHIDDGVLIVWLAMDNNQIVSIVAMCVYELLPTASNISGKTGYIQNVYTLEEYRRKGLVTQLLKKLIDDAKN